LFRRIWAGLLSLLLTLGALSALPSPAAAAMTEEDYLAAARQLSKYGLVQGDDRGYRFYAQITRAEMAKLLVYTLGMQNDVPRYAGRGVFSDTQGHWADGIIAVAKTVGVMKGYPEGIFRPEAPLTYAEVITALSRLVGLEAGPDPWPATYLAPATQAGIIPEQMPVHMWLSDTAPRGDVFVLLWRTLTEVKNAQGQNLLRRYLDRTAPQLTVDPQPKETTDLALTVSGTVKDAEQVLINGKPATLAFGGYFREDVSLRMGPNTIRIQAVDSAGNVREETVQVTRTQSPINTMGFTGPTQVAAGQTASFTVDIRDQNGEPMADRKSVTATVQPPSLGTFDPLTGVFTAGTAPGTGTITLKAGGTQSTLAVTVVGGALDRIEVVPSIAEVAAKGTVQFAVKGVDAYGNTVPVGAPQWSASGGIITAAGGYTAPDQAGVYTITATAGGKTATATAQPPNYKAASVRLSKPATTLKANGIGELTLTATVLDADGSPLTDYTGNLTLSSSDPDVADPTAASVPVTAGVAQFIVRAGTQAGTAQIKAATNLAATGSAQVTVAAQRLQSVKLVGTALSNQPGTLATGYVEAIALDEDGNPMVSPLRDPMTIRLRVTIAGTGTVRFIQNGQPEAFIAIGDVDPSTGDVRTRTHLQYDPGVGTMLIEGTPEGTGAYVRVLSGALRADQVGMPVKVMIERVMETVAGAPADIYAVALDEDNYRVTQAAALANVDIKLRDENGIYYPTADSANGRWHFQVSQRTAGVHTYTATLLPVGAEATFKATVIPGTVDRVTLEAEPDTIQADNESKTTLKAELVDSNGNRVTSGLYEATFQNLTNRGVTQPVTGEPVPFVKGLAQVVVRASTVANTDTFQVTVAGVGSATADVTTRGWPERLAISYGSNDGNAVPNEPADSAGQAGRPVTVYVDVVDRFSGVATYDNGRVITLVARNQETLKETKVASEKTEDGRATFFLTLPAAGTYALKATSDDLVQSVTAGYGGAVSNLVLQPDDQIHLRVAADLTVLRPNTASDGSKPNYALITATLVDLTGAPVTNQTGRPITVLLNIPANCTTNAKLGCFTTNDQASGTRTALRSVEIPDGASTSTEVKFFSGSSTGETTVTWTTQDGITSAFAIVTKSATDRALTVTAAPVTLPNTQIVTVTVTGSDGKRQSSANGNVKLELKDDDTQIVEVWDPATGSWQPLGGDTDEATVQADRGQAQFRVQAGSSGAKLYSATYGSLKADGNGVFYPQ